MSVSNEDTGAEQPAIKIFKELNYEYEYGFDISPGGVKPLRDSFDQTILKPRLRKALDKINGRLSDDEFEQVIYQIKQMPSTSLIQNNKHCLDLLKRGVTVTKKGKDESRQIMLIDFKDKLNNDFLIVNQFKLKNTEYSRRPDLLVFLNGFCISDIEFKNPNDENATLYTALKKNVRPYKKEFPELFYFNQIIVLADDNNAKAGSLTADFSYYFPWRTLEKKYPANYSNMEVLIREIFTKENLIDIIENFIVYEDDSKILAMYHQYDAVNKAVEKTVSTKDEKIGVIWHTQGSGKSFSMVFYVTKLMKRQEMNVPTILIVTDRDELDEQITKTFSKSMFPDIAKSDLRAQSIENLRKKLVNLPQGGVFFTLIHKFNTLRKKDDEGKIKILEKEHPLLNDRDNIIVIVDEAHRTQYSKLHRNMKRALPHAKFIGFTGTPIEIDAKHNTRTTFGDFISTYTIIQSETDKNTVPIYYEGRKAELNINSKELDELFEDYIKNYQEEEKEKFRKKWGRLSVLIGDTKRVTKVAKDIVEHFNKNKLKGKGMIVAVNRKTAIKYKEIIESLPNAPTVEVVISGTEKDWIEKGYIKDKRGLSKLREDFKDANKEPQLIVVCDMLLTGYSAKPLTTLYLDQPMKNHSLFQAIARVNRVFKDKPAGLIVDYVGIADRVNEALSRYSKTDREHTMKAQKLAIALMFEKLDKIKKLITTLDFKEWDTNDSLELSRTRRKVMNDILRDKKVKMDFLKLALELKKTYAIASTSKEAIEIEFEVSVVDSLRVGIIKMASVDVGEVEIEDSVIENLISKKLEVKGMTDIVNIRKSKQIKLTGKDYLDAIKNESDNKNLQIELLKKILNDEIRVRFGRNVTKSKRFKERIENALAKYESRYITTAMVIQTLLEIGDDIQNTENEYDKLGLSKQEEAFYDLLIEHKDFLLSAKPLIVAEASVPYGTNKEEVDFLVKISKELTEYLQKNTRKQIDWQSSVGFKKNTRAGLKDLLRKYGFKTSQVKEIIKMIMNQTEYTFGDSIAEI
jgi:type I restriction enzyme, R subunit